MNIISNIFLCLCFFILGKSVGKHIAFNICINEVMKIRDEYENN